MTEHQDTKVTEELGTSSWSFVGQEGKNEDGWKVYQTASGKLFAVCPEGTGVSFEVYEEDGYFIRY